MIRFCLVLAFLTVFVWPHTGEAMSCTPGTDCWQDCVKGPATLGNYKNAACQTRSTPVDTQVLLAEGFEAPSLYNDVGAGSGPPWYGSWYSAGGVLGVDDRGEDGYWYRTYGNGNVLWTWPNPVSPSRGLICGYGAGSPHGTQGCLGMPTYDAAGNRWDGNNYSPPIQIIRNGEFGSYIPGETPPTGAEGGNTGVFDGTASLGELVKNMNPLGIQGGITFSPVTTFSITQAVALASNYNVQSPTQLANNWKYAEWAGPSGGAGGDGLFMFGLAGADNTINPWYGFIFYGGSFNSAWCDEDLQAAQGQNCNRDAQGNLAPTTLQLNQICAYLQRNMVVSIGNFTCTDAGGYWTGSASVYNRATDWPYGTWACPQAQFSGVSSTTTHIEAWFTGPAGVRKKVLDISGYDTHHSYYLASGLNRYVFNNYANANSSAVCGADCGHGPTARYEDNIHLTASATAPTCASIGYAASGGPPPPPPPNNGPAGFNSLDSFSIKH